MPRIFVVLISLLFIMFLSPVFILNIIIIKYGSRGPAFFRQRRIGLNDKEFIMYKFRTMIVDTPEIATDKLRDADFHITRVGRYLRKYSIDEIPQLLNILLGDMSFVGPRPALYNQYELRKLRTNLGISKLKPGLTGFAQVNGRNEIPLERKIELDLYYLKNQSLIMDSKIIYYTICSLYKGNG